MISFLDPSSLPFAPLEEYEEAYTQTYSTSHPAILERNQFFRAMRATSASRSP